MNKENQFSPIVIAGMHRSGTSMLSKILENGDIKLGSMKDTNHESLFFQRINIWMMSLISSSWDSPREFLDIDSKVIDDISIQLNQLLESRSNMLYFGWRALFLKKKFSDMQSYWGWKDPRNTFTADLWSNIFPDMKIIYVVRHPIDIAESLMSRQGKEIKNDLSRVKKIDGVVKTLLKINHTNYNSSMIINSYEACFKLIDLYYNKISKRNLDNSIIVRFEDLLFNPREKFNDIFKFCGLNVGEDYLDRIESQIVESRGFSYKKYPRLLEFESEYEGLISKMGYDFNND